MTENNTCVPLRDGVKQREIATGRQIEIRFRAGQPGNIKHMEDNEVKDIHDLQAAMDTVFGLKESEQNTKKIVTLQDLYVHFTGDRGFTGVFNPRNLPSELRASMSINSGSFPNALANTLNRFVSLGYNKINYFENILISQKQPASSFRNCSFVQLGNWDDLPNIDPETADYPDMPNLTDKGNLFSLLQKGCVIPISRRVIQSDDLGVLQKLMIQLGLVARKTHARYAWSHFINNTNSNDGTAWFSAVHGNLGSGVFSISSLTNAITSLANMTESGPSSDKIGLDLSDFQWHLVVPVSMWGEAVKINQTKSYYTSNDLTSKTINPCYRLFGANNERIATPQFLSEPNDWGVIRDPSEAPLLEMQYLNGKQEPEIFLDRNPLSEKAFSGDWFGLKARHEYGGAVSDHRGAYKSTPA